MRCGAPDCAWRTTKMSASIATRLSTVSSSVSPFDVDDAPMLRLITSADRRFAAISNVVRVRVEFSKNRLNTALPRSSGTFFTSRSAIDTKGCAVSRMLVMTGAGRPSSVSRWVSSPWALSCGILHAAQRAAACSTSSRRRSASFDSTIDRSRATVEPHAAVGRLDRQLAAAAIDEHGQLDPRGAAVVEEFVDRRAHAAARCRARRRRGRLSRRRRRTAARCAWRPP